MVSWGYQLDAPYKDLSEGHFDDLVNLGGHTVTHEWPTRPNGLYPATKIWGEAMARYCADVHNLSTLCLRIGWVSAENTPHKPESSAVWRSQRDAVQLVQRSIDASEGLCFGIFFGVKGFEEYVPR